jgi:hypothetical protein
MKPKCCLASSKHTSIIVQEFKSSRISLADKEVSAFRNAPLLHIVCKILAVFDLFVWCSCVNPYFQSRLKT